MNTPIHRTITLIIVHCSATREGQNPTVADIDSWHRQRGWKCIGYHYVVYRDGSVHPGRPEAMKGAHCKNHNAHSLGICYIGGLDADGRAKDTRTQAQKEALLRLLRELRQRHPRALIVGHNVLARKECPCFDAAGEYRHLQPTDSL
ncbi:MAG: N-acetylmuramoyl-L-alanine amidase [Bacteroidaceae bacterium]